MDFSKYPIEKLVFYAAGIIPGLVALLIFNERSPTAFTSFFGIPFLGYRAKLAVMLLVAFVVGNAITMLLAIIVAVIIGIVVSIVYRRGSKPPTTVAVAPWRDPRWRAVAKKCLGVAAPADAPFVSESRFQMGLLAFDRIPEPERGIKKLKIQQEKLEGDAADLEWSQWYDHFHQIVLKPDPHDFEFYFRWGLNLNLEGAAAYALVASIFVPEIRHWWWIVPAFVWIVVGAAEFASVVKRALDKWSTLADQIKYLSESLPKNI